MDSFLHTRPKCLSLWRQSLHHVPTKHHYCSGSHGNRKNHNKGKQQPLCPDVTFLIIALSAGQEQIPVLLIKENDLIVSSDRRSNVWVHSSVSWKRPHSITHLKAPLQKSPCLHHCTHQTPRSPSALSAWRQPFSFSSAGLALILSSSPEEVLVCRWLTSRVSAESGLIKTAFDCSRRRPHHPARHDPNAVSDLLKASESFITIKVEWPCGENET